MKSMKSMSVLLLFGILALFIVGCTDEFPNTGNTPNTPNDEIPVGDLPPAPSPPGTGLFGPKYAGDIIAGNEAPYIDFNNEDYQKATADGKVVLLYFFSLQSGASVADQNFVKDAFDEMTNPNIIGFRVNIDDTDTSATEKDLATNLSVTRARTKIILKDGKVMQRSSSEWNSNDYIRQITQYLD